MLVAFAGEGAVDLAVRRGTESSAQAPQHFLYFLPLPQGHRSFLPILGIARTIGENAALGLRLVRAKLSFAPYVPLRLLSRKHAHHPISARVSTTRR